MLDFSALDFVTRDNPESTYTDEVWLRLEELTQITDARPLYIQDARQTLREIRDTAQLDTRLKKGMALLVRHSGDCHRGSNYHAEMKKTA